MTFLSASPFDWLGTQSHSEPSPDGFRRPRVRCRYYEEFKVRIPRAEVASIADAVRDVAQSILPGTLCVPVGSYRRYAPDRICHIICSEEGIVLAHVQYHALWSWWLDSSGCQEVGDGGEGLPKCE